MSSIEHNLGIEPQMDLQEDLEIYHNLPQLEPIVRGLKNDLTPEFPNPNLIIPVLVPGLSFGGKTTVLSQIWEEIDRDWGVQTWEIKQTMMQHYYYLDTGMVRELGTHLGIIKHEQGSLTLADYQGLSDLTEELVPLGLDYLKGPGQLGLELVWVTAIGENIGTPRGSLRLASRLAANTNARFIVLATPEDLKDQMEESREKARLATPAEVKQIADGAGNIHSIQDPERIHAIYMLASNKATRIQQAHDIAKGIWAIFETEQNRFNNNFEDFQSYFFDSITGAVLKERYNEWDQLVYRHHVRWLEQIFHKPIAQIDISRGAAIENTPLLVPEEETKNQPPALKPRHLYDSRLLSASLYKALIAESRKHGASVTLQKAVKRLELEKLTIYSLT